MLALHAHLLPTLELHHHRMNFPVPSPCSCACAASTPPFPQTGNYSFLFLILYLTHFQLSTIFMWQVNNNYNYNYNYPSVIHSQTHRLVYVVCQLNSIEASRPWRLRISAPLLSLMASPEEEQQQQPQNPSPAAATFPPVKLLTLLPSVTAHTFCGIPPSQPPPHS